jgi:hypothetical protein
MQRHVLYMSSILALARAGHTQLANSLLPVRQCQGLLWHGQGRGYLSLRPALTQLPGGLYASAAFIQQESSLPSDAEGRVAAFEAEWRARCAVPSDLCTTLPQWYEHKAPLPANPLSTDPGASCHWQLTSFVPNHNSNSTQCLIHWTYTRTHMKICV